MGSSVSVQKHSSPEVAVSMCRGLLKIMKAQRKADAYAKKTKSFSGPSHTMLCGVGMKCCPDRVIIWDLSNVPMTKRALDYFYDLLKNEDVWMVYLIGSEIDENLLEAMKGMCGSRLHCEIYPRNRDGSESDLVDRRIADLIQTYSRLSNLELACFTGDGNLEHGQFSIIEAVKEACKKVCVHMYAPLGGLSKCYIGVPNIFIIDWSSNSMSSSQRTTPIIVDCNLSSRSTSCSPSLSSGGSSRSPPPSFLGASSRTPPPRVVIKDVPPLKGSINSAKK